jgi:hypothetical protein
MRTFDDREPDERVKFELDPKPVSHQSLVCRRCSKMIFDEIMKQDEEKDIFKTHSTEYCLGCCNEE